jgi:2-polyprenyl-3-methyl-5-hydroxy-6-metoxy-1,4-benzoquinol methylase
VIPSPRDYWDPLWTEGRRYRPLAPAETVLLAEHLGPGNGRPALDIGSGDGALARNLHHQLGYRTTGINCAPSAVALAESLDTVTGTNPTWRCADITTEDLGALPDLAYAVITCRLVYRWATDKPGFLSRIRQLLAPGGCFWVVTEVDGRRHPSDPLQDLGITRADAELLTAGWSVVRTADLDVLRCYALQP